MTSKIGVTGVTSLAIKYIRCRNGCNEGVTRGVLGVANGLFCYFLESAKIFFQRIYWVS